MAILKSDNQLCSITASKNYTEWKVVAYLSENTTTKVKTFMIMVWW